jgi:hypothetical protein
MTMPGTGLEPVRGKPPQDFKSPLINANVLIFLKIVYDNVKVCK